MQTARSHAAGTAPDLALSPLAGGLNREWRRDYERRGRPAPPEWKNDARLAPYRTVASVLIDLEEPSTPAARTEGLLRALVDRAGAGDRQAARVLVQYLLPFLVRVAHRELGRRGHSLSDVLDELVTVAWATVAGGVDVGRRTATIALLRTIEYRALRCPARVRARRRVREMPASDVDAAGSSLRLRSRLPAADLGGRSRQGSANAGEELLRLLAEAVADGLGRDDARLVGALFLAGATTEDLGAAVGRTARTLRSRRAAALRRLFEWAA
jgi:hypothetical protein